MRMRTGKTAPALRNSTLVFACVAGALVTGGCELSGLAGALTPPFAYESLRLVSGDRGVLHREAGLYVTLRNAGDLAITRLTLAFDLYDRAGAPLPEQGHNSFHAVIPVSLSPGAQGSWCISLDGIASGAVSGEPSAAGVRVARFRVHELERSDGSTWRNPGSYLYEADVQ